MKEFELGPITVKYGEKMEIKLSDIPTLFHKIPGATDILEEVFQANSNRYQLYNRLVKRDPALNNAITKMAIMTQRAYKGIILHPGSELTDDEKTLLKEAKKKAEKLRFSQRFYTIARRLLLDGDVVIVKDLKNDRLNFLPMELTTALNSLEDITTPPTVTAGDTVYPGPPGVYIFNEAAGASMWKVYKTSEVVHIPLGNDAEFVIDNQQRLTWGIWSLAPTEALRPTLLWRLQTMINDMIWRKLYLPREHHQLDLTDVLDPDQYEGETLADRRVAALAAANTTILAYIEKLKNQMPDQGYVTPKVGDVEGVKISIVEPKSTTYVDPNQLLKQLAQNVSDAYFNKAVSDTNASFAAELSAASVEQMVAEFIASIIKIYMLDVLRESLGNTELCEELDIKLQLILPKDVESLTRQVGVLSSAHIYTIDEERDILGKDPLTDGDREKLYKEAEKLGKGGPHTLSPEEQKAQELRTNPNKSPEAKTPEGQFANQQT